MLAKAPILERWNAVVQGATLRAENQWDKVRTSLLGQALAGSTKKKRNGQSSSWEGLTQSGRTRLSFLGYGDSKP